MAPSSSLTDTLSEGEDESPSTVLASIDPETKLAGQTDGSGSSHPAPRANRRFPAVCHHVHWPFTLSIRKVVVTLKRGWGGEMKIQESKGTKFDSCSSWELGNRE